MANRDRGLLVLDKPEGITSHSAVHRVRRALGVRRAGHAGTLDPLATGVLLVGLGRSTRLLEYLVGHDKGYRARVRLGLRTDTLDREGRVVRTVPVPPLDDDTIERALEPLRGPLEQIPPAYSSVKQGGVPLHRRIRRGETVEPAPRAVCVHRLTLVGREENDLELDIACSKGTYVRALARDLGETLGTGATLWHLTRTRSGPFDLGDTVGLDEVVSLGANAWERVRPPAQMVQDLTPIVVSADEVARLIQGRPVEDRRPHSGPGPLVAFGPEGTLVAIVQGEEGGLRPVKVFPPGES